MSIVLQRFIMILGDFHKTIQVEILIGFSSCLLCISKLYHFHSSLPLFFQLGTKLPTSMKDIFEYYDYGQKSGVRPEYKKDYEDMCGMILKEICGINITLNDIINVLHHLGV